MSEDIYHQTEIHKVIYHKINRRNSLSVGEDIEYDLSTVTRYNGAKDPFANIAE
jgi:hypothetical protein